ncbi:MAG: carboxypeptidase-like regulatory domain-containing protein [Taibaiella sp.]|nr:carboxypeptidase-like regulatory domain-containing protein [Taibaiella sp.]
MVLNKALLLLLLLCIGLPSTGQTTDTARHTDTARAAINPVSVADTLHRDTVAAPRRGYTISGKIADMNTSEGLPFAIVFFPHANMGTTADMDGRFSFAVDSLPEDSVKIQAMGYKPVSMALKKDVFEYNLAIELERASNTLNEVVIKADGEDPGVILMRKIIAHKPQNDPDRLDNYSYEAYNRLEADLQRLSRAQFQKAPLLRSYSFIFDNLDTVSEAQPYLPLYLTETLSDFYFSRKPKKQREFIKASIVKGVNNENIVKYLGTLYQNINIYKNYIPVFDKKFVSPISNDAIFYYRFKIKDTQTVYNHRVILVHFWPKRAGESCFEGDFYVVDTSYAIQRISMDISKLANINWVDKISLYQEYAPADSTWFCIKDKFIANFTIYDSKKLPGFIGRKTTTYHQIKVNDTSVTKVLVNPEWKEEIIKSDSARLMTDEWWLHNRPDSLSKNEKAIYKMVDTINSMPITTIYKNTINFLASGVRDIGWLQLGPYYYLYSINPVEGNRFRLSLGTSRKLKDAHFDAFIAYGDRDRRFKYGASGMWILNRSPRMTIYAYYAHDVNQSTNYYGQVGSDNIFSTLFRKSGVPWKLAFSDDERVQFYKEYYNGFSHRLILQHRVYTPYRPLPSAAIFRDVDGKPSGSVISSEAGIEFRYAYKEKYLEGQYRRLRLANKWPIFNLEVMKGFKGVLNSGYEYTKLRFSISESINIPPLGHLYYYLFAGRYYGNLPYPLLEIHPGNEYYYYNKNSFQMMNNYEFLSDKYCGFNIEHNIGGGIFNRIPVIKKLKFRQFWTAKGVVGSLSWKNQKLNLDNSGEYLFRTLRGDPYLELGTGVSNIFHIFRIDFVWRVTPKPISEEAKSKYFGIFGSANFEF